MRFRRGWVPAFLSLLGLGAMGVAAVALGIGIAIWLQWRLDPDPPVPPVSPWPDIRPWLWIAAWSLSLAVALAVSAVGIHRGFPGRWLRRRGP